MQLTGHGARHFSQPEHSSGTMITSIPWLKMAPNWGGQCRMHASQLMHSDISLRNGACFHFGLRWRVSRRSTRPVTEGTAPILRPAGPHTTNVPRRRLAREASREDGWPGRPARTTARVPASKELSTVAKYPFLSPQWVEAAKTIREDYRGKIPATAHVMRLNQVITEVPFGDGTINAHVDT